MENRVTRTVWQRAIAAALMGSGMLSRPAVRLPPPPPPPPAEPVGAAPRHVELSGNTSWRRFKRAVARGHVVGRPSLSEMKRHDWFGRPGAARS